MAKVVASEKRVIPDHPRLLGWFVIGTLLTFVATSILVKTYALIGSGAGVVEVPLWKYYLIEFGRWANSSGGLGPASGNLVPVLINLAEHILVSVGAGVVFLGLEWAVHKVGSARAR